MPAWSGAEVFFCREPDRRKRKKQWGYRARRPL